MLISRNFACKFYLSVSARTDQLFCRYNLSDISCLNINHCGNGIWDKFYVDFPAYNSITFTALVGRIMETYLARCCDTIIFMFMIPMLNAMQVYMSLYTMIRSMTDQVTGDIVTFSDSLSISSLKVTCPPETAVCRTVLLTKQNKFGERKSVVTFRLLTVA